MLLQAIGPGVRLNCVPEGPEPSNSVLKRSLNEGMQMKTTRKLAVGAITAFLTLGMIGCGGMSQRQESTAIGAGVGAVGGAILTGGSPLGVVGGAAVGGVIGNQVGK